MRDNVKPRASSQALPEGWILSKRPTSAHELLEVPMRNQQPGRAVVNDLRRSAHIGRDNAKPRSHRFRHACRRAPVVVGGVDENGGSA